ncbi:TauD/TfdA family dioxygenase [Pseudophaeobacter sp. EL27]|uniref:TauD/TfdA family dioxygenase n=1 Tax=Pseudophaeobacter sp. EL27 TaxID=2107580 RepID=UPI000EFB9D04|nr:TauD/TfdA family dioxygenase [Pseudophaeobacter sp. EL27]
MRTERHSIRSVTSQNGLLAVQWGDGHESRFHAIWLRHQCWCPECGTPETGVRGIRLQHFDETITLSGVDFADTAVRVVWPDGHRSEYPARWLRNHCYSDTERASRRLAPVLWDATIAAHPPSGSLAEAEADPAARLRILEAVRDYGFCKITDAPKDSAERSRMIDLVGAQRQTHFGTYTLKTKKTVTNVGDTTGPLDPHMDEPYRYAAIGVTVFQVLHPSSNGGASTLVDGFEAVRRLKESWPEDFDMLCSMQITCQRFDPGDNSHGNERWYKSRLPVIQLDEQGEVCGVRMNERQISPLDVPADQVVPAYRALKRLFTILYDEDLCLTLDLKAGEGLLFDNQRLLHGRTGFTPETPPRAVLTSSVDLDDFHSSLRLLQRDLDPDAMHMVLRQGMAG